MNAALPVEEAYRILTDDKQNGHLVLLDELNGRSLRIPHCRSPIPTLKQSDLLPAHFMQLSAFGASF
jgi:hypothetical protein